MVNTNIIIADSTSSEKKYYFSVWTAYNQNNLKCSWVQVLFMNIAGYEVNNSPQFKRALPASHTLDKTAAVAKKRAKPAATKKAIQYWCLSYPVWLSPVFILKRHHLSDYFIVRLTNWCDGFILARPKLHLDCALIDTHALAIDDLAAHLLSLL